MSLLELKWKNYKLKLFYCPNDHTINNIKITDFQNSQMINMYDINCKEHKDKNMENSHKNKSFYRCLTCKTILCLLCKDNHEEDFEDHCIVKY